MYIKTERIFCFLVTWICC